MIRKLRIALANWIAPKEYRINPHLPCDYMARVFREIHSWRDGYDDRVLGAVKTFPAGLTFTDKK